MKIVVDTSVIVDHLRNVPQASRILMHVENGSFEGLVSALTVMEMQAIPAVTGVRSEDVRRLLLIFDLVPVNSAIAEAGSRYLRTYGTRGLGALDALVAATASVNDAALFTLNYDRFRFIEGLVVVNPYVY